MPSFLAVMLPHTTVFHLSLETNKWPINSWHLCLYVQLEWNTVAHGRATTGGEGISICKLLPTVCSQCTRLDFVLKFVSIFNFYTTKCIPYHLNKYPGSSMPTRSLRRGDPIIKSNTNKFALSSHIFVRIGALSVWRSLNSNKSWSPSKVDTRIRTHTSMKIQLRTIMATWPAQPPCFYLKKIFH